MPTITPSDVKLVFILLIGLVALAIVAMSIMTFRGPRAAVRQTLRQTVDAVSKRMGQPPRTKTGAPTELHAHSKVNFDLLRFEIRNSEPRLSFVVPREMFERQRSGVVLGRLSGGVDVKIDNKEISRRHARLFIDEHRVMIEDLGSTNGTSVDGTQLVARMPTPLANGSAVSLGPLRFEMLIVEAKPLT